MPPVPKSPETEKGTFLHSLGKGLHPVPAAPLPSTSVRPGPSVRGPQSPSHPAGPPYDSGQTSRSRRGRAREGPARYRNDPVCRDSFRDTYLIGKISNHERLWSPKKFVSFTMFIKRLVPTARPDGSRFRGGSQGGTRPGRSTWRWVRRDCEVLVQGRGYPLVVAGHPAFQLPQVGCPPSSRTDTGARLSGNDDRRRRLRNTCSTRPVSVRDLDRCFGGLRTPVYPRP